MIRGLFLAGVITVASVIAPAIHASAAPPTVAATPIKGTVAPSAPVPLNTSRCYWQNCTEAHQNGEGDIPQGSPHYCSKQDRDSDGVACEW